MIGGMTESRFRALALELPEALESAHMGHADFRVRNKIFASLLPERGCGMVKLSPDQQRELILCEPDMFDPVPGGWGRRGATLVLLRAAKTPQVRAALAMAWRNVAPNSLCDSNDLR